MKNKELPHDIQSEITVLSCLMLKDDAMSRVIDILDSSDFYNERHQTIFSACASLYSKGMPIDVLTVSNELKINGDLELSGGASYLTEIISNSLATRNIESYANIVHDKALLRNMISTAINIQESAYEQYDSPAVILDRMESELFKITKSSSAKKLETVSGELETSFNRIDRLSGDSTELRGLETGFTSLDNRLAGLQKSDLIILAARPSLGKSAMAMDIALHAGVRLKKSVAIFSLEMSKDQIIDRFIANLSGVNLWKLRTGSCLKDGDFAGIREAIKELLDCNIFIDDGASSGTLKMKALARRLQAQGKLDLIIVDYLQLMDSGSRSSNIVQQMTEISRSLKIMAKELNVPILALSQLSRAVEHRIPPRPRLSDLRESGAIEQDADVVLMINREDKYKKSADKNVAEIIIAKHRNGPVGTLKLFFDEDTASFKNL